MRPMIPIRRPPPARPCDPTVRVVAGRPDAARGRRGRPERQCPSLPRPVGYRQEHACDSTRRRRLAAAGRRRHPRHPSRRHLECGARLRGRAPPPRLSRGRGTPPRGRSTHVEGVIRSTVTPSMARHSTWPSAPCRSVTSSWSSAPTTTDPRALRFPSPMGSRLLCEHAFHAADEPAELTRQAFERAAAVTAEIPLHRLRTPTGLHTMISTMAELSRLDAELG